MSTHDPHDHPSEDPTTSEPTPPDQEMPRDDPGEERGVLLSDVPAQRLRWLWDKRILRRKLTILEGDPGLGKSLFTLDLAARVTTGRPMPDDSPGVQGSVILIAPEDGVMDAIKPRFDAAGGDPSHMHLLPYVTIHNTRTDRTRVSVLTLPNHLPFLAANIKDTHAVLVIIDPLTAVLAPGSNPASDQNIRQILIPLAILAKETGCSILIVYHHNKGSFDNLLDRSGGEMGFLAAHRTGLLVFQDLFDEDTRILTTTKNNFSAKASNLTYQVVVNADSIPSIRWLGTNQTSAPFLFTGGSYHRPHYSFGRQILLKALQASYVPLSPKTLAIQTGQDHTLVKQMLRRMLDAGHILSPAYGLYTARNHPSPEKIIFENNTPATPTTLTTPATLDHRDPNLANTSATPATPTTLTTPATLNHRDPNLANTSATPTTLTTPATLNHSG
ncbi:MAG: AAA family ATPase [Ktedonobacteraceae bacterium]